jgi:hypothetical protein
MITPALNTTLHTREATWTARCPSNFAIVNMENSESSLLTRPTRYWEPPHEQASVKLVSNTRKKTGVLNHS